MARWSNGLKFIFIYLLNFSKNSLFKWFGITLALTNIKQEINKIENSNLPILLDQVDLLSVWLVFDRVRSSLLSGEALNRTTRKQNWTGEKSSESGGQPKRRLSLKNRESEKNLNET